MSNRKPIDIKRIRNVKKHFTLTKWLDSEELGRHIRNRIYKNYGDCFVGEVPSKERIIQYIEEYLTGEFDYTTDVKFECFDEFKLNRGIVD